MCCQYPNPIQPHLLLPFSPKALELLPLALAWLHRSQTSTTRQSCFEFCMPASTNGEQVPGANARRPSASRSPSLWIFWSPVKCYESPSLSFPFDWHISHSPLSLALSLQKQRWQAAVTMRFIKGVALNHSSDSLWHKRKIKFMHEMVPTKFDIGEIQMMQRENKTQATIFFFFFTAALSSRVKIKNRSASEMLAGLAGRKKQVLVHCSWHFKTRVSVSCQKYRALGFCKSRSGQPHDKLLHLILRAHKQIGAECQRFRKFAENFLGGTCVLSTHHLPWTHSVVFHLT